MKLLIVANYAKGHINKFHIPTIKKFKSEGWQVDVACRLDAEVEGCDNAYDLPIGRNPFNLKSISAIKKLKKIIQENKYDVVHLHTFTGRLVGTFATKKFRKQGTKLVVTYHGLNYYKGSSLKSKLLIPLDRYLSKFTDLSFSDNQEDIEYGKRKGLKMDNCVFCLISIKTERLLPLDIHKAKREQVRKTLGIAEDEKALIYLAEVYKNKNQTYLLEVLKDLKERGNKVKLLLVGPENDDGYVRNKIEQMGLTNNCMLLGWRDDVGDLLCASDIYVASSIREGLGINLIEAMLVGLPIVATNNRGHREVVIDGENGYLVSLNDSKTFANKVDQLIKDQQLANKFVEKGFNIYQEKFSKKTEEVIFNEYKEKLGL
ncbi:MAG: glycosyltransferase [Clostridia bacterium]|nr:glycosyltransferase [Clostridia bacterium]